MFDANHDARVRAATFAWLEEQVRRHGDVLPRSILTQGFEYEGTRVPLAGPQGIFKPKLLSEAPLTITTVAGGPYDDQLDSSGSLLLYRYRGTDPKHHENRGLRFAMQYRLPLVYLIGLTAGRYLAAWPSYVVGDEPTSLAFSIQVDDTTSIGQLTYDTDPSIHLDNALVQDRRAYVTRAVRVRVHQRAFRERILGAYGRQCAFCRLRHEALLDAAHIIPDGHPNGQPVVQNGLALCALHHTAFDRLFVGLTPDFSIEVRPDILKEKDGPTLVYAIQSLHKLKMSLPRKPSDRPDQDRVSFRYQQFRAGMGAQPFDADTKTGLSY